MKTTILNQRFLYLILILSLTFSFNSCSDDDDGGDEPKTQTFLEKYDSTKWIRVGEVGEHIIRFNNNLNGPYDVYFQEEIGSCFVSWNLNDKVNEFKITKNLNDEFTFEVTTGDDTDLLKCTVQGETLKIVDQYKGEETTTFFEKTSRNLNDLLICN